MTPEQTKVYHFWFSFQIKQKCNARSNTGMLKILGEPKQAKNNVKTDAIM